LGCSHGPLRIQRHDALVSVVHHTLLQDHPGVLHEQGTSTSDRSRPGDIYHPNFRLGHPAYFDLSVRCTTQSPVISSAASQAGVAAAAGEEVKDNQYFDIVNLVIYITAKSLYSMSPDPCGLEARLGN